MAGSARVVADFEGPRFVAVERIDFDDSITARARKIGFAEVAVFGRARIAGPIAMAHGLMNVAEREITNPLANIFQILRGKAAALANKIFRTCMEQEHVRAIWLESGYNLADLVRRGRAKITAAEETDTMKIDKRAALAAIVPRHQQWPGSIKSRSQQNQ